MKQTSHRILTLVACGAAAAFIQTSSAQTASPTSDKACPSEHHGKGAMGGNHLEWLTKELSLTTDQQASIKPILDAEQTQIKTICADTSLTKEQTKEKVKAEREAANGKINGLLTADQQAKLAQIKQEHHHGGEHHDSATK